MLDRNYFINQMAVLTELYNQQLSDVLLDIYYSVFEKYSKEELNYAVQMCIRDHKYHTLPKPADLLSYVEGSKEDKSLMAWMEAKDAVQKVGFYNSVLFKDNVIALAIEQIGGWMEFCRTETIELPFVEKRFREAYRLLSKRGESKNRVLIGFTEITNRKKGWEFPKPIKIGFDGEEKKEEIGKTQTKINSLVNIVLNK